MRTLLTLFALLLANDAAATDVLTTVRAIRPATIIAQSDLARMPSEERGALADFKDVVGFESLVTLYPGRPILPEHLGPPAIVNRNQFVPLVFEHGTLLITTEGRALGRGAAGDWVRVLNTTSKNTVTGRISDDGRVVVTSQR